MEEPLEQHFPILPTMDDFDKLTEDATLKYKTFMDIIASGRAELDQMKLDIVEKITIHERVIIFFFFFFYIHLTPHSPNGMARSKDYAGAHRAKASAYKRAAIPTPQAITTDPDKVLTQKEKQTTL